MIPTTRSDFDRAYRGLFTVWGDPRIPDEVATLVREQAPESALELGCGVGRITRYLAKQGVHTTGVDFSSVAIEKARSRAADLPLHFLVGDVTHLDGLEGPFDVSFDVGCFHCLDAAGQRRYAAEIFRLLKPGCTHLIWALDHPPSGIALTPAAIRDAFAAGFELRQARPSRRRVVRSHWYWVTRSAAENAPLIAPGLTGTALEAGHPTS